MADDKDNGNGNGKDIEKTKQTSKGLRTTLFEALDDLRADRITPQKAREISKTASVILISVKLEIDAARFASIMPPKRKLTIVEDGKQIKEDEKKPTIPVLDL